MICGILLQEQKNRPWQMDTEGQGLEDLEESDYSEVKERDYQQWQLITSSCLGLDKIY